MLRRAISEFNALSRSRRPKQIRWRVTLRGQVLGYVFALTSPAACERAVRRWRIPVEQQVEMRVEKDEP